MREIIQKVIEAEAEAQRVVAEAEAEAARLVAEAREQAGARLESVRTATREAADRTVAEAEAAARREREQRLAEAAGNIAGRIRLDEARRQAAVELVVRRVCGTG